VLILGASGGVGVCCLMLAKSAGAEVIACGGSDEKCARLKELGADHVINYMKVDFLEAVRERYGRPIRRGPGKGGVDVVVNYTGGDTWVKSLRCLRRGGRLLTSGATAGFDPKEDIRYIWTFELNVCGSNGFAREDVTALFDLVKTGKIEVVIDAKFPLDRATDALALLEDRKVFGKVLVTP
jgi:alcohol dehydrogenase